MWDKSRGNLIAGKVVLSISETLNNNLTSATSSESVITTSKGSEPKTGYSKRPNIT